MDSIMIQPVKHLSVGGRACFSREAKLDFLKSKSLQQITSEAADDVYARLEDEFAHCQENEAYYITNKAERKTEGGGSKTSTIIKTTGGYWREMRMDEFTANPETIPANARNQMKENVACRIRVKQPETPEGSYSESEEFEEEGDEVDETEE